LGAGGAPPSDSTAAWSLALIIHRVLKDAHPSEVATLDGLPVPLGDEILNRRYGRFTPQLIGGNVVPVDLGIPYRRLPDEIRWMLELTFNFGRLTPEQRVSPHLWVDALGRWQSRRRRSYAAVGLLSAVGLSGLRCAAPETPAAPAPIGAARIQIEGAPAVGRPALWTPTDDGGW
jgi:hypothetical protein